MRNRLQRDQQGAVAMLTVIFVAIVLSIVVTGFIRLSVSNQREAIDDDLTTRAFYAAETGVENARQQLVQYLEDGISPETDTCGDPVTLTNSDGQDSAYTCVLIDISPNSFVADLEANGRAVLIPLRTNAGYDNVRVEWHISNGETTYNLRGDSSFPPVSEWGDAPALLRVQTFRARNTSSASVDDWRTTNSAGNGQHDISMFVPPLQGGAQSAVIGSPNIFTNANINANDRTVATPYCVASVEEGGYVCSVTLAVIGNPGGNWSNYLNIRSLYKDTTIRVTANSGNNPVEFNDVQALVDVTGRANDIFRRVETRIPITSVSELEDFAVVSADRVCKYFAVTDDPSDFATQPVDSEDYLCE